MSDVFTRIFTKKNTIIISVTVFILLGLGLGLYFGLKKSSSSLPNPPNPPPPPPPPAHSIVTIQLTGLPVSYLTILSQTISQMSVMSFISTILATINGLPITPCWETSSVNNEEVEISSCVFSDTRMVTDLLGDNIPSQITFSATFTQNCAGLPQPSCTDICSGEALVCTSTGWVCQKYVTCSTGDFSACCANSPSGVYPTCENGFVSCGPCPGSPDCPSGCSGYGGVCTASGWICQENISCPPDPSTWGNCITCGSGTAPYCINGVFSCSSCSGTPNCGPPGCSGMGGFCTESGWVCQEHVTCPLDPSTWGQCISCPSGQFASCTNGIFSCSPCAGSPNCGAPGCSGIGGVCTASGWICQENVTCPDPSLWPSCETSCSSSQYPVCINGVFSCSSCSGSPNCQPDCNMNGPVCENGSYTCQDGITCPPPGILQTCCSGLTPIASCNGNSIICSDCSNIPYPEGTPCSTGSCQGHGWVCTAQGWSCLPGITCATDPIVLQSCCPSGPYSASSPVCDPVSKCIMCQCASGMSGCTNPVCSGNLTPCESLCCPPNNPCNTDSNGNCLCCPKAQICNINGSNSSSCCPPGTICLNNNCVPPCGIDCNSGDPYLCSSGQSCIEIDNLSSDAIQGLISEYGTGVHFSCGTGATSAFICLEPSSCEFIGNETSIPAAIDNYYPCYPFLGSNPTDSNHPGVGYCFSTSGKQVSGCASKINPTDCANTSGCEWRDVLNFMTTNNADPSISAVQIQNEMIQNLEFEPWNLGYAAEGFYCDATNSVMPFSRIVTFTAASGSCDWQDCWGRIAQPGIIDVDYNEDTGICVGLQTCGTTPGMSSSFVTTNSQGPIKVPNPYTVSPTNTPNNSVFQLSCPSATCPSQITGSSPQQYFCSTDGFGTIFESKYDCVTQPGGGQACVLSSNGKYTDSDCSGECGCAQGYTKGSDGVCYKSVFNSGCSVQFQTCGGEHCTEGECSAGKNWCGLGWESCCSGSCQNKTCNCRCYLGTEVIPFGHAWCDRPTKSWKICNISDGCTDGTESCSDSTAWQARLSTCGFNECMDASEPNEASQYCVIP